MGKITINHFINTNLKPYIINGERYYSIYLLISANRQNTKVKSKVFNEYYKESDFKEIINSKNEETSALINNEVETIINVTNMLIDEVGAFDPTLFAGVYSYLDTIFIGELELDYTKKSKLNLYTKNKNKLNIELDRFIFGEFGMAENQANGISVYNWFSDKGQKELNSFLIENKCGIDICQAIEYLNKIVFLRSLDKLSWIFKGSKKYEKLTDKYYNTFELSEEKAQKYYKELSI